MMRQVGWMVCGTLILAACTSGPKPAPASSPTEVPTAVERPTTKRILQSEAEQRCVLQAVKRDGVRISDVQVVETKKVDAGYRTKLRIGDVDRTCLLTHEGEYRSYQ